MMDGTRDTSHQPVTSLDLLMELQGEQKAFRFLTRADVPKCLSRGVTEVCC